MASTVRRAAPIVLPATKQHTATVIFIHGLGDSGAGWADAVEHMKRRRQRLDEVKFVLPNAPPIPITMVKWGLPDAWLVRHQSPGLLRGLAGCPLGRRRWTRYPAVPGLCALPDPGRDQVRHFCRSHHARRLLAGRRLRQALAGRGRPAALHRRSERGQPRRSALPALGDVPGAEGRWCGRDAGVRGV
ncbi:hypothetical protein Golomagni_07649, partial [Golovinomyces magnicellulatus]